MWSNPVKWSSNVSPAFPSKSEEEVGFILIHSFDTHVVLALEVKKKHLNALLYSESWLSEAYMSYKSKWLILA